MVLSWILACTSVDKPPDDLFRIDIQSIESFALNAPYWLTYHYCDTEKFDCFDPMKHQTQVASSIDGERWSVFTSIPSFKGSVPDILYRDHQLYVYALPKLHHFDLGKRKETISHFHVLDKEDNLVLQVDPSPIIDEEGRITLFFLVGIAGVDPARCPQSQRSCNKIFRSATEILNHFFL